ncbi:hypothetical protein T4A_12998, partial [Trichinella pseudospiralis]
LLWLIIIIKRPSRRQKLIQTIEFIVCVRFTAMNEYVRRRVIFSQNCANGFCGLTTVRWLTWQLDSINFWNGRRIRFKLQNGKCQAWHEGLHIKRPLTFSFASDQVSIQHCINGSIANLARVADDYRSGN